MAEVRLTIGTGAITQTATVPLGEELVIVIEGDDVRGNVNDTGIVAVRWSTTAQGATLAPAQSTLSATFTPTTTGNSAVTVSGMFPSGEPFTGTLAVTVTAPSTTPKLGLYTGSNTVAADQQLARALGVTLNGYSTYCTGSTYQTITGYTPPALGGLTLMLGVNGSPDTPKTHGLPSTPAQAPNYAAMAKRLPPGTICRPCWEFDGNWFSWGIGPASASGGGNSPAELKAAWRAVVLAMKAANSELLFDFCCNSGTSTLAQLEAAYPGDDVVDFIGGDHYDHATGGGDASQMGACVALAAKQGKPLSVGEWGLNGIDDPAFIAAMAQLVLDPVAASKRYGWPPYTVGYHSYFSDALSIDSDITRFPSSMAEFKTAFAGS